MTVEDAKNNFHLGQSVTVNNPHWNGRRGTVTPSDHPDGRHVIELRGRACVHVSFGGGVWDYVDADELR